MKLFDRMLLVSMKKRETNMAGRIVTCVAMFIIACMSTYYAVILPGARVFFVILALLMVLGIAGIIITNIVRNKW